MILDTRYVKVSGYGHRNGQAISPLAFTEFETIRPTWNAIQGRRPQHGSARHPLHVGQNALHSGLRKRWNRT